MPRTAPGPQKSSTVDTFVTRLCYLSRIAMRHVYSILTGTCRHKCDITAFLPLMGDFVYTGRPTNSRQLLKRRPVQNRNVPSVGTFARKVAHGRHEAGRCVPVSCRFMRFHALMGHFVYTGRPTNSRQLLKRWPVQNRNVPSVGTFARKVAHGRHEAGRCVPVSCRFMRFHALMGHFVYTGRPANSHQLLRRRPVQNRNVPSARFSHAR